MEISLPADLEKYLEKEVARGVYPSANEAIVAAVQCLKEQGPVYGINGALTLEEVEEKVTAGFKQLDEGLGRRWEDVFEELKTELAHRKRTDA